METNKPKASTQRHLVIFLLLAWGITWLCWIPTLLIADSRGYILPTIPKIDQLLAEGFKDPQHVLLSLVFSLGVYGPLVGALVATYRHAERKGLADLVARTTKWRVNVKWYAIALGVAIAIAIVPRLIAELTGQIQAGGTAERWTAPTLLGFFLWQLLTSSLGEEPGWRGYLLPHLRKRQSTGRTVWILGLIWAVWHYPFTAYDTLSNVGPAPAIQSVVTVVMALLGQTMSLVGMTHIYVWLYSHTESVFLAIVFHALTNFLPAVLLAGVKPSLSLLVAVMPWIVVLVLDQVDSLENEREGSMKAEPQK